MAVFRSLQGESLEDFSIRLAQAWRIGQRGLDNGVIFLVFLDDRKMRIEVGYGLEATLPDAVAGSIIRDVVAPRFREGRLAEGIEAGLDAVAAAIAGTYQQPVAVRRVPTGGLGKDDLLVVGGFGVFILFFVFAVVKATREQRRKRRRGLTGSRDGWVVPASAGSSSWSSDSSSSSSSSSDSFSGGGGSFGGGGASGDW